MKGKIIGKGIEKKYKEEYWEKKVNSTTFYKNPVSLGAHV